jgi:arylsulfatase A-like enzyme
MKRRAPLSFVLALAALGGGFAFVVGCGRAPKRPNVLLVTIDTLRADRLEREMPALMRVAGEGSRLERAIAPRAKTTPSIATLLSGLQPHAHGVRDLAAPLAGDVPLLQEALRRHGWRTGAIVGNWVLKDEHSGLARGFDLWVEDLPQKTGVPPHDAPQRTAASLVDGALHALGLGPRATDGGPRTTLAEDGEAWFLWLHLMDPHGAYEPPRALRRAPATPRWIDPRDPARPRRHVAEYNAPPEARDEIGRIDAAMVEALHDGEVRHVDAELSRLFDALRGSGAWADTLVLVTADHGESFGEDDYWFEHGRNASEATLRVPLVAKLPADSPWRFDASAARGEAALADLAPTMLEWLGLPPLPAARRGASQLDGGTSLASAWCSGAVPARPIFGEKVERAGLAGAVQHKVARLHPWRLEQRLARDEAGRLRLVGETLHDVAADPACELDLLGDPPPGAPLVELRALLADWIAADAGLAGLDVELERRREDLRRKDPSALRALEALGY